MLCGRGKIGHDERTLYDTKLASYELRLNRLMSYSGWHDWFV